VQNFVVENTVLQHSEIKLMKNNGIWVTGYITELITIRRVERRIAFKYSLAV